ncbi:hypothetical protein V8E53_005077 [Lactarius tabidus]
MLCCVCLCAHLVRIVHLDCICCSIVSTSSSTCISYPCSYLYPVPVAHLFCMSSNLYKSLPLAFECNFPLLLLSKTILLISNEPVNTDTYIALAPIPHSCDQSSSNCLCLSPFLFSRVRLPLGSTPLKLFIYFKKSIFVHLGEQNLM